MTGRRYCLDSDVLIWHLRKGGRQQAVAEHLAKLAMSGTLVCSILAVAEVEQGARNRRRARFCGRSRPIRSIAPSPNVPVKSFECSAPAV